MFERADAVLGLHYFWVGCLEVQESNHEADWPCLLNGEPLEVET